MNSDNETMVEVKKLLGVPRDEPIFILRAQDNATPQTIDQYMLNARTCGADRNFINGIGGISFDFSRWRQDNQDRCKIPD